MKKRSLEEIIDAFDRGETADIVENAPEVEFEIAGAIKRKKDASKVLRIPGQLVKIVEELIELYEPNDVHGIIAREAKTKRAKAA
ncbi:MAG: hypothetical protein WA705_31135 [Candidatus Ozemobacteraceae bacterium]